MPGNKVRRTAILAHLEDYTTGPYAYGDVAAPATTDPVDAEAIQIMNPQLSPIEGEYIDFDYIRPYMGNSPRIQASRHVALNFSTPLTGGIGPQGMIPPWSSLMRMCGMAMTEVETEWLPGQLAADADLGATSIKYVDSNSTGDKFAVGDVIRTENVWRLKGAIPTSTTITAVNTTTNTITLSAPLTASVVKGMKFVFSRDTLDLTTTGSAASGTDRITVSTNLEHIRTGQRITHASIPADTYIKYFNSTTGVIVLSAATTGIIADASTVQLDYKHISYNTINSDHEYGTIWYFDDVERVVHKMKGVRGSWKVIASPGEMPRIEWTMLGLYIRPIDVTSVPSPDLSNWNKPTAVYNANSSCFYAGINLNAGVFEVDCANVLEYRNLIGAEDVLITDRKSTGRVSWEANQLSEAHWFDRVNDGESGPLQFQRGATSNPGNRFYIHADDMSLFNLTFDERNGIRFYQGDMSFVPTSGNDDIYIRLA